MKRYFLLFPALLIFVAPGFSQTDTKPFFTVEGEVEKSLKLTVDDLKQFNLTEVKAKTKKEMNTPTKAYYSLIF
jgi:hypothetical protein